ncbi:Crp/Fnr family transcriptional regulator [Crenobacter intestini]|uniref:Crp/Fnr family transcriptional regulator n=1 Tax=Crenobacter intestini TaxID=2563443 RepID=A0A4T0UT57_9NEIS|nr:Crp/Fnr family transcriptional regulator [Crenobacter intestini]TIC82104.1 Crp/Fnr family transcriptional regulator [Crenobacter intestini]
MDLSVLFPLFAGWPAAEREALRAHASEHTFTADSEVCTAEQAADQVILVEYGLMAAYAAGERPGRSFNYGYILPGDIIGLHGLLSVEAYGVAIHALRDTRCLILPNAALVAAFDADPARWRAVAGQLAQSVHHLLGFVSMLAEPSGYRRLKRVLENIDTYTRQRPFAPRMVLTQRELGERIGLSREMVNRILRELKAGGYVGVDEEGGIRLLRPLPARF